MKATLLCPALVATALVLAGCTAPGVKGCVSTGDPDFAGKTLTVLSHGAFGSFRTIKPLFEELTGATLVELQGPDAGGALRDAVTSKGAPLADVLYGVDNLLFHTALEEEIFEAYNSPNLAFLNANVTLSDFQLNGVTHATPVDHAYVSVNYDVGLLDALLGAALPATLKDLAGPSWASKLVVENPNLSSPGLAFLVTTVKAFGETGNYTYLDYWRDLLENGALVTDGWTEAYVYHYTGGFGKSLVDTFVGGRSLVVSYTTSPAVEVLFGAAAPPGVSFEPPLGVFHQVETMGILKCTRNLELAQTFIDFALSPDFQNTVAPEMAVYPAIKAVELPAEFHQHATDPAHLPVVPFDAIADGPTIPTWLQAWTNVYHASQV